MKLDVQYDIMDCITELNRIVADLRAAANDVQRCIIGNPSGSCKNPQRNRR